MRFEHNEIILKVGEMDKMQKLFFETEKGYIGKHEFVTKIYFSQTVSVILKIKCEVCEPKVEIRLDNEKQQRLEIKKNFNVLPKTVKEYSGLKIENTGNLPLRVCFSKTSKDNTVNMKSMNPIELLPTQNVCPLFVLSPNGNQEAKTTFILSVHELEGHQIKEVRLVLLVTACWPVLNVITKDCTFYPKDIGHTVKKKITLKSKFAPIEISSIVGSDIVAVPFTGYPIVINANRDYDMYLNITPPKILSFSPHITITTNCEQAEQVFQLHYKVQMALIEVTPKVVEAGDWPKDKKEMEITLLIRNNGNNKGLMCVGAEMFNSTIKMVPKLYEKEFTIWPNCEKKVKFDIKFKNDSEINNSFSGIICVKQKHAISKCIVPVIWRSSNQTRDSMPIKNVTEENNHPCVISGEMCQYIEILLMKLNGDTNLVASVFMPFLFRSIVLQNDSKVLVDCIACDTFDVNLWNLMFMEYLQRKMNEKEEMFFKNPGNIRDALEITMENF